MKAYTLSRTDDPELFRILDTEGDWTHYWDEETKQSLRAVNFILARGYNKGFRYYEVLKNSTPEEWERKLKRGGDRGDAVHQAIRQGLTTGSFRISDHVLSEDNNTPRNLTLDEWQAVLSFARFWNDHRMILATSTSFERSVKNIQVGYAGTLDLLAIITKSCSNRYCECAKYLDKLGLWDHKSGKGIYNDYGPQTASYSKCNLTKIIGNRKIEYTAIDHLGVGTERGYRTEFYDEKETEQHWKEFLAAETIMWNEYKPFNLEKENGDIPEEATIDTFRVLASEAIQIPKTKTIKKNGKGKRSK